MMILGVIGLLVIFYVLAYFGDTEFHSQQRLQQERLEELSKELSKHSK